MTTDAQAALAQVREALAAGPTPGPWYLRTNRHPTTDGRAWGWLDTQPPGGSQCAPPGLQITWERGSKSATNAAYIAACNPEAIRELLAEHDEDQRVIAVWRGRTERAEDERDALKAEIDRLREWQRQMVEKAASGGRLDGYRELAGKLAAKDAENDRLRAALVAAMAIVQQDRTDMYIGSVHARTGELAPEDAEAIARLDAIIAQADEALGRKG